MSWGAGIVGRVDHLRVRGVREVDSVFIKTITVYLYKILQYMSTSIILYDARVNVVCASCAYELGCRFMWTVEDHT